MTGETPVPPAALERGASPPAEARGAVEGRVVRAVVDDLAAAALIDVADVAAEIAHAVIVVDARAEAVRLDAVFTGRIADALLVGGAAAEELIDAPREFRGAVRIVQATDARAVVAADAERLRTVRVLRARVGAARRAALRVLGALGDADDAPRAGHVRDQDADVIDEATEGAIAASILLLTRRATARAAEHVDADGVAERARHV
jgi:hypothetical protein